MDYSAQDIEQYRSLRQRAMARALDAAEVHAYVDARRGLSAAVLTEQRNQVSSGQKLRGQARARVHIPITLQQHEWETDTFINDLSQGGCSLFLSTKPTQDNFPFKLYLQGGITVCGHADVVATRPRGEGFHISLRFRPLAADAYHCIEDTVLDALVGS